ncbi:MAG TPA: hypothetical protein VE620_07265, partial [Myxococcales bacterium]|nr:hypothetical protein [Myxococcales bacterium]
RARIAAAHSLRFGSKADQKLSAGTNATVTASIRHERRDRKWAKPLAEPITRAAILAAHFAHA